MLGPRERSGSAGGTSFQHFHWWLVLKRTTILTNVVVVSFWIFSHTAAMCLFQYAPFWNGPPERHAIARSHATPAPQSTPRGGRRKNGPQGPTRRARAFESWPPGGGKQSLSGARFSSSEAWVQLKLSSLRVSSRALDFGDSKAGFEFLALHFLFCLFLL